MTIHDKFLAHTNKLLKEHLASPTFTGLERLNIKISIYDIFQENQDLEEIYYQLLDYLEKDGKLKPLAAKIEMYYSSLTRSQTELASKSSACLSGRQGRRTDTLTSGN